MRKMKKFLAFLLVVCMMAGYLPANVEAASETAVEAALSEAKTYIDKLTVNNTSNDPATVVKDTSKFFSWDYEQRKSPSKAYLYEWSYYNGVVFEGLDYVYDVTGEIVYKDYVDEYLSNMIGSDGLLNSYAGYVDYHGADCYKTASLLLDYGYTTAAEELYKDLQDAQSSYTSSDRGGNYNHTWKSPSTYAVWLDGLYMILPFMAEYASYTKDTAELNKIVERFTWVSENMYNSGMGLFYHMANSGETGGYYNNSDKYWGRAIGWYAAAMVDVMDYMTGDNLATMQAQFKKLVDGMLKYQTSDGMWRQFVNVDSSTKETSVTALMAYAIQKAVNNGWLDDSYVEYAQNAFVGICDYALDNNQLKYICHKGSHTAYSEPTETTYINEGKGVGPFIMAYAEIQEYVNGEKEVTKKDEATGVEVTATGITGLTVETINVADIASAVAKVLIGSLVAYDIEVADFQEGSTATVNVPIPSGMNPDKFAVYYVADDGTLELMDGKKLDDDTYQFTTTHFSTYVGGEVATAAEEPAEVSGTGNLVGGTVYTLDTNGVTVGTNYLIVNSSTNGTGYALTNNNGSAGRTSVTVSNSTITVEDDTNIAWVFSGATSGSIVNNDTYIRLGNSDVLGNSRTLTISNRGSGAYRISYSSGRDTYYLRYNNDSWSRNSSASNVYLYEYTSSSSGEAVTFTVTHGSATLKPEDTVALIGTVTVAGETVNLSDCTITWASDDEDIAIVSNGTVAGVADGTANITATLSAVDGTALQENIVLTIPVTVLSKAIVSANLVGNDPVTTRQNVEPDFSNIKLEVTYDDGTTGTIPYNQLTIEGYDITTIGYSYATISYAGVEYGTVRVTVEGNPYEGKEEATVYPEYPADGAVRIAKNAKEIDFENTGVVQVEIDVAGVSVKPAVDVILVTDLSNSMAWAAGGRIDATSHEGTKVYDLQQSVASFADIFLAVDEEGNASNNTMSLVTFGGYDADHTNTVYSEYADPTQTLLVGSKDANAVKNTVNNIRVLADDVLNIGTSTTGYYLSFDGGETYGENYGNTNYDHAFMQTADAIADLKAAYKEENGTDYDVSGRQIYVLFMTDGAPSNYDGVYYNYKTGNRADVACTWINEDGEEVTYTMGNNRAQYQAGPWFQYIAGGTYSNGTIPGNPLYWADQVANTANVANIYSIGFDIDNGGFSNMTFTESDGRPLSKVLEKLVTGKTLDVFSADDSEGLSKIYSDLATKIRYAGTNANVSDTVGSDFTLQLTQTTGSESSKVHGDLGFKPTITIKAYELWTKEETNDSALIGTRKTNEDKTYVTTDLETVTFSDDGKAFSDKIDGGNTNILSTASDGTVTIEAHLFTYTKTPEGLETFDWRLGNITEQEVALSFYAYLKGALEGECAKGLYYTNEEATLEYVDINDKYATQTFPVPAVAWGGASTAYEFYLVNEEGKPCDRNGNEIPFANRIIITGPYYEELYLNQEDENVAREIVAAKVLPAGYTLYDETAKYTVVTASGNINKGSLTISEPAANKAQTTQIVSATEPSYIQSHVAFGVMYNLIPEEAEFELTPNKVVIDYGKSILIHTNDDEELEKGYSATLVGFSKYYDSVDLKDKFTNTSAIDDFDASYGKFSIESAEERIVRYTPNTFVNGVDNIFCVLKMTNNTNANDFYYMVDWLAVIPATNVYYETDFANVFELATTGESWKTSTVEGDAESKEETDKVQNDGTIGVNQTYGYDSSYTDDAYLSDGSSLFVEGQGIKLNESATSYTYTQFEFTGTGFDLISRTGAEQGAIRVDIYKDVARTEKERSVTVLNKSESNLELYQIPVVSVNELPYGTYYVTIGVNAAYTNESYPSLNRGAEFYFDAIRIYDPAKGNAEAEVAYVADGESAPVITEVRSQLIAAEDYDVIDASESIDGMTFIDRTQGSADVATYTTIGPDNEVYLSKDQGIAFEITSTKDLASIDIAVKAPNSGAATQLTANISASADTTGTGIEKNIISATPQYYNLMENAATDLATIFANGKAYVVVRNTGDGVLSITDIKVAYGNVPGTVAYTVSADAITFANTVFNGVAGEEPNYDIISAEFTSGTCKLLRTATMEIVTSPDVEKIVIKGLFGLNANPSIKNIETNDEGQLVWTVQMGMYILGSRTYTITGYGADGTSGTSATANIRVTLF